MHMENSKRNKVALVTGCSGQDGSYLADILLAKGYNVHGLIRRTSKPNTQNIRHLLYDQEIFNKRFFLHDGDISDQGSLTRIIKEVQPDEVYNFAAMAGVGPSFTQPEYALDTAGLGVLRLLEAIRTVKPDTKFFQAGSSHIFGDTPAVPQTEVTIKQPISPYGVAKSMGQHLVHYYREAYGMYCCSAIFYAHASPRYSEGFLLSKIIHSLWRIQSGEQQNLELGNLDVEMDIGYAQEFMEAVFNIMHQDKPEDFIICTGETHTSQEFLDAALEVSGVSPDKVKIDESLKRQSEVSVLVGDYSKANKAFGYKPNIKFKDLVSLMYDSRFKAGRN